MTKDLKSSERAKIKEGVQAALDYISFGTGQYSPKQARGHLRRVLTLIEDEKRENSIFVHFKLGI